MEERMKELTPHDILEMYDRKKFQDGVIVGIPLTILLVVSVVEIGSWWKVEEQEAESLRIELVEALGHYERG